MDGTASKQGRKVEGGMTVLSQWVGEEFLVGGKFGLADVTAEVF